MSLFSNDNENKFNKDSTYGIFFNGERVKEKYNFANYMTIIVLQEYKHTSVEELRLADYEKDKLEKIKFLIIIYLVQ